MGGLGRLNMAWGFKVMDLHIDSKVMICYVKTRGCGSVAGKRLFQQINSLLERWIGRSKFVILKGK